MFVPAVSVCCSVQSEVMRIIELADTVVGLLGLECDPVAEDREYVVLALAHPYRIGLVAMINPVHLNVSVFVPESCDDLARRFIEMMESSDVRCDYYPINLEDHPMIHAALLPIEAEEVVIVRACRYLADEVVFDNSFD